MPEKPTWAARAPAILDELAGLADGLTSVEIASLLGMSSRQAQHFIKRPSVGAKRIGRRWVVSRDDLRIYIETTAAEELKNHRGRSKAERTIREKFHLDELATEEVDLNESPMELRRTAFARAAAALALRSAEFVRPRFVLRVMMPELLEYVRHHGLDDLPWLSIEPGVVTIRGNPEQVLQYLACLAESLTVQANFEEFVRRLSCSQESLTA